MTPPRVHYLPSPDFPSLLCGTPYIHFANLRTTQDESRVDCRRCLWYIGPYRANPAALAAYAAGCSIGYGIGYRDGFDDALYIDDDNDDIDVDDDAADDWYDDWG